MDTTTQDPRDVVGTTLVHSESTRPLTLTESTAVDVRQDDLMKGASPDGRPPTHLLRRVGWRWFAIIGVLAVSGAIAWMLITGVRVSTIIGLGMLGVVFAVLGGWPVLMSGLQRGREERGARKDAKSQLHVQERVG